MNDQSQPAATQASAHHSMLKWLKDQARWRYAVIAVVGLVAASLVWQRSPVQPAVFSEIPPIPDAFTPWWAGTWTAADGKETPQLTLRGHRQGIAGEATFFLNDGGYLVRRPLLWAAADADKGVVFRLPPSPGLSDPYYVLTPPRDGEAELYQLRDVATALRQGGKGAALIPVHLAKSHIFLSPMIRAGDHPARLETPAIKPAPKKEAKS